MKQYPKIRVKILKYLLNNPKYRYAYKISKELSVSYSIIYYEIYNMLNDKLIKISKERLN